MPNLSSQSNRLSLEPWKRMFSLKAGNIRLQVNNRRDYFYADDVCAFEIMPCYERLIGIAKIDFDDNGFSTQGTQTTFRKVCLDRKETIIGGFYQDTMPAPELIPYEVKIYIRYEEMPEEPRKEIKQNTCQ